MRLSGYSSVIVCSTAIACGDSATTPADMTVQSDETVLMPDPQALYRVTFDAS